MFALGAKYSDDEEKYMNLGAGISNTCHESYKRSGSSHVFCYDVEAFSVLFIGQGMTSINL